MQLRIDLHSTSFEPLVALARWQEEQQHGGIANSASTRGVFRFGPEVAYLEVEFDGNATQAVTVEAHATTYTY